jgi:hypothetical protein
MSTLEYLDEKGSVKGFHLVPWTTLHTWLSVLNGNTSISTTLPQGVNRGKVIEELEARRREQNRSLFDGALRVIHIDRGLGKDWRDYENPQGFTHLEELLIYQPVEWRKQAREYLFRYNVDLTRESPRELEEETDRRSIVALVNGKEIRIVMKSPILVVLFHTDIKRTDRYEPLNFLLAYGVSNPLPALFRDMSGADQQALMEDLSPPRLLFGIPKLRGGVPFGLAPTDWEAGWTISHLPRQGA